MEKFNGFSIKVKNFKCFGETLSGFETIKPINLIIGRNNSGKSALLDIIEYSIDRINNKPDFPKTLWHSNKQPELIATVPLTESNVRAAFPENRSRGGIPGVNHNQFGNKLIGAHISWEIQLNNAKRYVNLGTSPDGTRPFDEVQTRDKSSYLQQLAQFITNPLEGMIFQRINAERNILPEDDNEALYINGSGEGTTNVIQNFINIHSLPGDLVEDALLIDLNRIFSPDAHFKRITCQKVSNKKWEIYLDEDAKGRIPLSQSGSGLKTIIMVLAYVHLLPVMEKKELSQFIFGFEELENNLHPSLFRRLLTYIRACASKDNCTFFLTTHSNVTIDFFNKDKNAQILHVTHDKTVASVKTVSTYIENRGILDDLDVRASDLLQSNCVIWVEGPSDRIYLNRWISLWTNGELTEGNHYQCVFYGGRLLAHLSSDEPEVVQGSISILRVNRNSAIMIDSDKKIQKSELNKTKLRIIEEIKSNSGFAWVTSGREIENYIPAKVVSKWLEREDAEIKQSEPYEDFFGYLDGINDEKKMGKYYKTRKPLLAEKLGQHFLKEDLKDVLDLSQKLDELCAAIKSWNNI